MCQRAYRFNHRSMCYLQNPGGPMRVNVTGSKPVAYLLLLAKLTHAVVGFVPDKRHPGD
jgi:hypothetical protein